MILFSMGKIYEDIPIHAEITRTTTKDAIAPGPYHDNVNPRGYMSSRTQPIVSNVTT